MTMSSSKQQYEINSNAVWRKFADGLKASEDYLSVGVKLCEHVKEFLRQRWRHSDLSISSTYYGGSVGKNTDVINPDFDIVMKVNSRMPPFHDILEHMRSCLYVHALSLKINRDTIKTTPFSLNFEFTNKMKVDVLLGTANWTTEQVLMQIKQTSPDKRRYFSSSLVEHQVHFMREQGAHAHAVARLAKWWLKSMDNIQGNFSGDSLIFELLAVAACRKQRELHPNCRESVIDAFLLVVGYVEQMNQLSLSFDSVLLRFLRIRERTVVPYILEPSNPMNNLLEGMKTEVMTTLMKNGRVMRDRLNGMMEKQIVNVDFVTFFRH